MRIWRVFCLSSRAALKETYLAEEAGELLLSLSSGASELETEDSLIPTEIPIYNAQKGKNPPLL